MDSNTTSNLDQYNETEPAKKHYQSPKVTVYGSVNDITRAVGPNGMNDGSGGNVRTG